MANGQFAELASRFILVVADTKNGRSDITAKFSLKRNRAYFLILDREGAEFDRLELTGSNNEFDDEVIAKLEAMESRHHRGQQEIIEYLLTWFVARSDVDSMLNGLVAQLDSRKYAERESASQELESLGEPAYQYLRTYRPLNPESRRRAQTISRLLKMRRDTIVRFGLDHDIEYLINYQKENPAMTTYLERILPAGVPINGVQQWWNGDGQGYQWDVDSRRFVLSPIDAADENQ